MLLRWVAMTEKIGRSITDYVQKLVGEFVPDMRKIMISTCHDGAANMMKCSNLLKVEGVQHCAAHALHLLLTVDSLNTEPEIEELSRKCRDIELVDEELACSEDKTVLESLKAKLAQVCKLMDLEDQFPLIADDEEESEAPTNGMQSKHQHRHSSLKLSCPTRWNSFLQMIQSVLDLLREVQVALKRIGKAELCLDAEEISLLKELAKCLDPFQSFTDLFSNNCPTLSLVPLVKLQIKKHR
jgi:hypothetical protein